MNPIIAVLIAAAAKVGAPVVKGVLEKHLGGTAGDIAGTVIDEIAAQAGVTPEQLPSIPPGELEDAVAAVEVRTPELILAQVEQQKETNRLMLEEMKQESAFGWMWRPAGMWLMLGCVLWYVALRPIVNAVLWATGTATQIEMGLDVGTFITIFMAYVGLYMGGNTLIRTVGKEK